MNTTQLECFLAVANCLNFSRAAEQLRLTQPAVSHQISTLEDELGVKLFKRTSKSVRLTQEGYLPAYHLNKEHWAAARLDGTLPMEQVKQLLSMSFEMVTPKRKRRAKTEGNAEI